MYDDFLFGRQGLLDILLQPPQQEGPEYLMQLGNHFLVYRQILLHRLSHRHVEPVLEILLRVEDWWHQEVHQRPEFVYVVLQRGSYIRVKEWEWKKGPFLDYYVNTCYKKSSFAFEFKKCLSSLRFKILDLMCFIQNNVIPSFSLKRFLILYDKFVTRNTNITEIQIRPPLIN